MNLYLIWLILVLLSLLFCLKSDSVFYCCDNVDHTKWSVFCSWILKEFNCENLILLNQWIKRKTSTVTFRRYVVTTACDNTVYLDTAGIMEVICWDRSHSSWLKYYCLSDLFSVFLCVCFHTANKTSFCLRRKWK